MPKKKRTDWTKERAKFSGKSFDNLIKKAGAHQNKMYSFVLPYLSDLDILDGKFKFTVGNMKNASRITSQAARQDSIFNQGIVKYIIDKIKKLVGLNTKYFNSFVDYKSETIEEKALRLTMEKLGFDNRAGKLIKGGYLEALAGNTATTESISSMINRAVASKMSLKDFRKQFKDVLVNPDGLGISERYFTTKTYDLFQANDRNVNNLYAEDLGLNFAVYSGTIIKTTRSFCKVRNNEVFHRSEIASWSELEWQGKNKMYDPFTDLGGYNCRHHLSWISDQIAKNAYHKDVENFK